jgi:S1-C subfamily serine protease
MEEKRLGKSMGFEYRGYLRLAISFVLVLLSMTAGFADEPIELEPILQSAEQQRIEAINKAMPSAVSVFVPGGGGGGSGVLISPEGYALTNFHVTSPAGSYMRCGLSDGNVYDAVLVGLDPVGDLAMIKLLGRDDFPYAEMGDSLLAQPGDWCMVIGNPFLLATNLQPTVTWGILSGVGRYQYPSGTLLEYADCLQTDASINPGNSGGPIYNADGQLLGIVGRCSFEKRGRVNVGVGYAISINQAKNFLGYLRSGRIVDHATLGATVTTDPDGGVVVSNILESSDAYRRGLRYNAEVLEIDGRPVTTANDVQNVLGTFPKDWRVEIAFRSDGQTKRVPVRLMGVHRRDELLAKMSSALPPPPPVPDAPPEQDDSDKDDSLPQGQRPDDQPPPMPKPANPHGGGGQRKASIPEVAAKLIVDRKGYANYYFNQLEQDRFIRTLRGQYPYAEANGEVNDTAALSWTITGKANGDAEVKITVGDKGRAIAVGQTAMQADNKVELFDGVDAGSLVGALAALEAWQRMLTLGPKRFGETYYQGTMPLAGERPLRDCTIALFAGLEFRFLMHPETGKLECIEALSDRDSDPAELWIRHDGDKVSSLDLRYGVDSMLNVTIDDWQQTVVADDQVNNGDGADDGKSDGTSTADEQVAADPSAAEQPANQEGQQ